MHEQEMNIPHSLGPPTSVFVSHRPSHLLWYPPPPKKKIPFLHARDQIEKKVWFKKSVTF